VALSSLMLSNPVKLASWPTLNVPLPTNSRTSVPAPPVRLSPALSVAEVAYTLAPDEGVTTVSLPVVRLTMPGEAGGAVVSSATVKELLETALWLPTASVIRAVRV
jgi:hypothetical protein